MAISVRPGAAEAIVASPERFAIQIEGADDVAAALAALRLVRVELVGLSGRAVRPAGDSGRDGGPVSHADVSPAVVGPAGPLVLVQHLDAEPAELDQIPGLVATRLAEAGVGTAVVAVPESGGRLDALDEALGAVVLRLFPVAGSPSAIPARWLDVAVDWIVADVSGTTAITARILSIEHAVKAATVADLLHDCGVAHAWCDLVTGEPTDRLRSASLTFGRLPHLALAAGGPGVDGAGLVARFELLRELARELADDVAYACLDFEPEFGGIGAGLPVTGWRARGGAPPNRVAAVALDDLVPDAYPWQVLGAGPAARLGASGEVPPWTVLAGGRVEIALGEPVSWLPRSAGRDEAQTVAIDWLAPVLADEDELDKIASGIGLPPPADAGSADAPDMQSIVLRPTTSPRRSTRLSLLELAAWLAHEPHTDMPASVSPVLACFLRIWASGLDDPTRQRLKPLAARLVGTGGDDDADRDRRWAVVDWLVRVHALRWLEAAGEQEAADELAGIDFLADRVQLGRAVDALAYYLARPSTLADDDRDGWEAWESVREAAGWMAASEAATQGGPPGVADAADHQVIEASRRATPGADPAAAAESMADDAWQAALGAIAGHGWEQAWRAADAVARDRSGLTIRIEMGRVAKATPVGVDASAGSEHDPAELEVAERAALAALLDATVRLGEGRDGPPDAGDGTSSPATHPWEAATGAARASAGGRTWSSVVDGSRQAVGQAVWDDAMAEARAATEACVTVGADTAARAVAVAVAREASSRAARTVAQRAVEAARAAGASPAEAAKTASDALAVIAADLVVATFAFVESLLPPQR